MIEKRTTYDWRCRNRTLRLGERTWVMGILNVTPDSFSDGGAFIDPDTAVARALEMIEQGVDLIDVGGESTRPGAVPVSAKEEIRRTVPVIKAIRSSSRIPMSIDTMKAAVAAAALEAGADIINDVSAFEADAHMIEVAADSGAGVILMHMKGSPQTMQDDPVYVDVVEEVCTYLKARIHVLQEAGIPREQIVVDPGIGFGKTVEHNTELLRNLGAFHACGCPVLVGVSRKRFIGSITGRTKAAERRAGSLGTAAWCITQHAHILRVHDVIDTCDVCRMLDTFAGGDM